jgi:HIRAN domain
MSARCLRGRAKLSSGNRTTSQRYVPRQAAGKAQSWDDHITVEAQLIPEPNNEFDRNAVAVLVNGRKVGYLPAEIAGDYQPVLLGLLRRGLFGTCKGAIVGGGSRSYGICLMVAEPEVISFLPRGAGARSTGRRVEPGHGDR